MVIGRFCACNLTWFSTAEHAKEFSVQLGYSLAVNRALVRDHVLEMVGSCFRQ